MTDPYIITHSDIHEYMKCRQKWSWSEYRKPEKKTGALPLGSRVHKAIERFYLDGTDPLTEYERLWKKDWEEEVEGSWAEEQFMEEILIGRNCVTSFLDWLGETGADSEYEVAGVEVLVETPFLGGKVMLRGKIDTLFRRIDNGFLVTNDFKTSARPERDIPALLKSWQHDIYSIIAGRMWPDEVLFGTMYTVLRKVKRIGRTTKPMVTRVPVPGSSIIPPHRVAQLERICHEMIALQARDDRLWAYPSPSDACAWCEYRLPCDLARDDPAAAQDMLTREFVGGHRLERYDGLTT